MRLLLILLCVSLMAVVAVPDADAGCRGCRSSALVVSSGFGFGFGFVQPQFVNTFGGFNSFGNRAVFINRGFNSFNRGFNSFGAFGNPGFINVRGFNNRAVFINQGFRGGRGGCGF